MGNTQVVPREAIGIRASSIEANAVTTIVSPRPSRYPSPITSFKSVGHACAFFKGRAEILSQINTILTGPEGLLYKKIFHERILVIHGIPGMGKSELMRRFAEVYSSEYPNIGWIDAESPTRIGQSFAAIADVLKVEWNSYVGPEDNVRKVYEHVSKYCGPNCLFIFDNVTDKKSEIHGFLPKDQSLVNPPLIVMTASEPISGYKDLRLDELTLKEAIEIFRDRQFLNLSEEQFSQVKGPLTELATLIDCHPLGIVISASYFRDTLFEDFEGSLDYYMKQVRELSVEFTEAEPEVPAAGTPYTKTLNALWQLTVKRIEKGLHSNAVLSILRLLAYVNPEVVKKDELRWLCLTDCPIEDEKYWTAFRDGSHIFNKALRKLVQLSILIPIPIKGMDTNDPKYYRVHRLIQRFAQRQDEPQLLGFARALYRCVDHSGTLIYPGCVEHLNVIVEKRMTVDEKLKQISAAFAVRAYDGDNLSSFIEYLDKDGEKTPETDNLLVLIQLYANYKREKQDPETDPMEYHWSVVGIAKDCIGPECGSYIIQHCATHIFIQMLFEGCEGSELTSLPKDYFGEVNAWVKGIIDLHNQQDGQDWKFFPKIIGDCMFKVYRVLQKVTDPSEKLNSVEDFVKCLVHRAYEYCGDDDELLDGYWHIMAITFRIKACERLFRDENMEFVVNHATDTLRRCTRANRLVVEIYDGFRDFLLIVGYPSDCVHKLLSSNSFLEELSGHTKMLVSTGFSSEHLLWLTVLGIAFRHDSEKVLKVLFLSWDPSELNLLLPYIEQAIAYATPRVSLDYGRSLAEHSKEVLSVLRQLEELESKPSDDLQGKLIAEIVKKLFPTSNCRPFMPMAGCSIREYVQR